MQCTKPWYGIIVPCSTCPGTGTVSRIGPCMRAGVCGTFTGTRRPCMVQRTWREARSKPESAAWACVYIYIYVCMHPLLWIDFHSKPSSTQQRQIKTKSPENLHIDVYIYIHIVLYVMSCQHRRSKSNGYQHCRWKPLMNTRAKGSWDRPWMDGWFVSPLDLEPLGPSLLRAHEAHGMWLNPILIPLWLKYNMICVPILIIIQMTSQLFVDRCGH